MQLMHSSHSWRSNAGNEALFFSKGFVEQPESRASFHDEFARKVSRPLASPPNRTTVPLLVLLCISQEAPLSHCFSRVRPTSIDRRCAVSFAELSPKQPTIANCACTRDWHSEVIKVCKFRRAK